MVAFASVVKGFLYFFHVFIWSTGMVIFGLGIFALADAGRTQQALRHDLIAEVVHLDRHGSHILIGVGVVVLIVSGFGFIATAKNSKGLHIATLVMATALLVATMVGVGFNIYALANEPYWVYLDVSNKVRYYDADQYQRNTRIVDSMQTEYMCCGSDNYKDYLSSSFNATHPNSVPDSCCFKPSPGCGTGAAALSFNEANKFISVLGCLPRVLNEKEGNDGHLLITGSVYVIVQTLGVAAIIFLLCRKATKIEDFMKTKLVDGSKSEFSTVA